MRKYRFKKIRSLKRKRHIKGKRVYKMWDIFLPGWRKVDWRKIEENL